MKPLKTPFTAAGIIRYCLVKKCRFLIYDEDFTMTWFFTKAFDNCDSEEPVPFNVDTILIIVLM